MPATIDLRKAHKHQRSGDLLSILTWVNDSRALVLMAARRRTGWFIVDESAAHLWGVDHPDADVKRDAMEHAVRQSYIACTMLDMEPSRMNRAKVISLVTGLMPDLIRMPTGPEQEYLPGDLGTMILSADGKPLKGEAIRNEDSGVSYA